MHLKAPHTLQRSNAHRNAENVWPRYHLTMATAKRCLNPTNRSAEAQSHSNYLTALNACAVEEK